MRFAIRPCAARCAAASFLVIGTAAAACREATAPTAALALSGAADFSGRVAHVTYEAANGPAGPYAQYDVWVAVGGSGAATAGVVVPTEGPVYLRGGGVVTPARPGDLRAGDVVEVWHDQTTAYGAAQGPPGAPTYTATQVVIDR